MRIAFIIAEFNPLHNGHAHLIRTVREILSPDKVAVIMNGSFSQRGEVMIADKYTRARHAVLAGADVVLELPQIAGVATAEKFAAAGVKIAEATAADEKYLCFGSEDGDLARLQRTATVIADEPQEVKNTMAELLDCGISHPAARHAALCEYAKTHGLDLTDTAKPNNILALEYLRAIKAQHAALTPFTVKRCDNYLDADACGDMPSATAVREAVRTANFNSVNLSVPAYVAADLAQTGCEDNLSAMICYKLSEMSAAALKRVPDVTEGLENRIMKLALTSRDADALINEACSKRYTASRIRRILINALLGVNKTLFEECFALPAYFKVLAINKASTAMLSLFSSCGTLITGEAEAAEHVIAATDAYAFNLQRIATGVIPQNNGMVIVDC